MPKGQKNERSILHSSGLLICVDKGGNNQSETLLDFIVIPFLWLLSGFVGLHEGNKFS